MRWAEIPDFVPWVPMVCSWSSAGVDTYSRGFEEFLYGSGSQFGHKTILKMRERSRSGERLLSSIGVKTTRITC